MPLRKLNFLRTLVAFILVCGLSGAGTAQSLPRAAQRDGPDPRGDRPIELEGLTYPVAMQEVLITGFPLGVGGGVDPVFFEPHYPLLRALADTLAVYPLARVVILGTADGNPYDDDHDAKNPGLSLGRAHALRNVLVDQFGVDPEQIFIQSNDVAARGVAFRAVRARLDRALSDLEARMVALEEMPPPLAVVEGDPRLAEEPPIEVIESMDLFYDNMSLRLSGGVSSSPFVGVIPMVSGAVLWKQTVALEAAVGHTFWNDSYVWKEANLSTWQRMISGRVTVYPWEHRRLGFVGGWVRVEEIAQSYYEYAKLSEGPAFGLTALPFANMSVTGLYNPARHRTADREFSRAKNGQFLISVTMHTDVGGGGVE